MANKKRLITSALPYVNNVPHLGNIIGAVLSADVFARYCKIAGYETLYICGTDEYGTTTETRAKQEGVTPAEICSKYHAIHKDIYDWFNIDFSFFGRTSDPKQKEIVQDVFWKLYKKGYIVEDVLVQPYCDHCKMYLADRYITGTCPFCEFEEAKGDQCDACGKLLEPKELKEPKCSTCKKTPVFKETKHLFLDLEKLRPELEEWINETSGKNGWSSNAVAVTKGWLEQGLKKRCITRDLEWGIPVPLEGFEDKVFYVWFDAPIGYISITAERFDNWKDWWKNPENTALYQFMGKDNIPFHTVLFPSSLIGSGDNWTRLNTISSTEYLNYENTKFSKSRGTGVFGDHVKDTGIDSDLFRYYLLRIRPEKNDTHFYWHDFMEKSNGEIIGNYGNLVNRVLQFVNRFFDNEIPQFLDKDNFFSTFDYDSKVSEIKDLYEKVELKKTLLSILEISSVANKYFQDSEPWAVIKEDKEKAGIIIGALCAFIKDLTILLSPYIPATALKVFEILNIDKDKMAIDNIGNYDDIVGKKINQAEVIFKKLDKKQIDKLHEKFMGEKEETPIDKFSKLNLKVGKIISIEKHPEADKLYVEKIDMGDGETRQIVSGLVDYYKEEELLDKKIIVVANLKAAKLRGVLSEGMVLAAETKDKSIVEVVFTDEEVGSNVIIEGATVGEKTIKIDDFFGVKIKVSDNTLNYEGNILTCNETPVKVEKVANGVVK